MKALLAFAILFNLDRETSMHIHLILAVLLAMFVAFALGYAFRGRIRKEIAIADRDALAFANRLDAARLKGQASVEAEAKQVAADIRAAVDKAASKI